MSQNHESQLYLYIHNSNVQILTLAEAYSTRSISSDMDQSGLILARPRVIQRIIPDTKGSFLLRPARAEVALPRCGKHRSIVDSAKSGQCKVLY
jgi:hypothetical protein